MSVHSYQAESGGGSIWHEASLNLCPQGWSNGQGVGCHWLGHEGLAGPLLVFCNIKCFQCGN